MASWQNSSFGYVSPFRRDIGSGIKAVSCAPAASAARSRPPAPALRALVCASSGGGGGTAGSSRGRCCITRIQPGPVRQPSSTGPGLAHYPLKNSRLCWLCPPQTQNDALCASPPPPFHKAVDSRDIILIISGIISQPKILNVGVCVSSPGPQALISLAAAALDVPTDG